MTSWGWPMDRTTWSSYWSQGDCMKALNSWIVSHSKSTLMSTLMICPESWLKRGWKWKRSRVLRKWWSSRMKSSTNCSSRRNTRSRSWRSRWRRKHMRKYKSGQVWLINSVQISRSIRWSVIIVVSLWMRRMSTANVRWTTNWWNLMNSSMCRWDTLLISRSTNSMGTRDTSSITRINRWTGWRCTRTKSRALRSNIKYS